MPYNKNESKIKILKICELELKFAKLAFTRNFQIFDMALIFIVIHHRSSYIFIIHWGVIG